MANSRARKSKAFSRFEATHVRAELLVALYKRLLKVRFKKKPTRFSHKDLADLLRSGLVLAVAAMDSYFTARFAELLVPFLKRHGPTDALVPKQANNGWALRRGAGCPVRARIILPDMGAGIVVLGCSLVRLTPRTCWAPT